MPQQGPQADYPREPSLYRKWLQPAKAAVMAPSDTVVAYRKYPSFTAFSDTHEVIMSIRSIIMSQIVEIAEQQKRRLAPLSDSLALLDSGLDSLCIAILVASLDDRFDLDPFSDDNSSLPVTVGEFITLYENAAA
jgi:acyl carrier protein